MKRAAVDHPKLQRLQRRLKLTRFQAMGLLEALWHFTGRYAPEGDIGRWSDEEIAAWIEWDGDPDALIADLVACGWLDKDGRYRLLVHDWSDHADEATKISLKRAGKVFAVPTKSDGVGTEPNGVGTQSPDTPRCSDSVATVLAPPEPEPCHAPPEPRREGRETAAGPPSSAPAVPALASSGSEHQVLMDAYTQAIGQWNPNGKPHLPSPGENGKAAKQLLQAGWAVPEVIACYRWLKSDPFWGGKLVTLTVVAKEIGEWDQAGRPAQWEKRRNGRHSRDNGKQPPTFEERRDQLLGRTPGGGRGEPGPDGGDAGEPEAPYPAGVGRVGFGPSPRGPDG